MYQSSCKIWHSHEKSYYYQSSEAFMMKICNEIFLGDQPCKYGVISSNSENDEQHGLQ
jgi:hypothetical protein